MKNTKILIAALLIIATLGVYFLVIRKPGKKHQKPTPTPKTTLPINTIPVKERPFVTLTPDSSGHRLTLYLDQATEKTLIEYELVYQSGDKQEGAFGRVNLAKEIQPVEKELLLGSKSAGGSVTYHEDITGGSLTLTYNDIKLKEDFNFTPFNPEEPTFSTKDTRFEATYAAGALREGSIAVLMKTFGLPEELEGEILAGPYAVLTASNISPAEVSFKLSNSEGDLKLLEYTGSSWQELDFSLKDSTLNAEPTANIFVVTN